MNKYINKIHKSRVLSAIVFFGLAGAIWGGFLYNGEPATFPLTAVGGLSLAIMGGLGLSLPFGSIKSILRTIGLGLVGAIIGFGLAGFGIYSLSLWSIQIFALLSLPISFIDFLELDPSLGIAAYWLNFALAGAFTSLFFSLGLKRKILPMVLRGVVGFGVAAIIGPIIGNLIGNLLNVLLLNYILTFGVICVIFGICLSVGMRRKQTETSGAT